MRKVQREGRTDYLHHVNGLVLWIRMNKGFELNTLLKTAVLAWLKLCSASHCHYCATGFFFFNFLMSWWFDNAPYRAFILAGCSLWPILWYLLHSKIPLKRCQNGEGSAPPSVCTDPLLRIAQVWFCLCVETPGLVDSGRKNVFSAEKGIRKLSCQTG